MKANQINFIINAIRSVLHKRIENFQATFEEASKKVNYFEDQLTHHERLNKNDTFRANTIKRCRQQIDSLEKGMYTIQLKEQKLEECVKHLSQLRDLIKGLISFSKLSYNFREYYFPVYKEIYATLQHPLSTDGQMLNSLLSPETVVVDLPSKQPERKGMR